MQQNRYWDFRECRWVAHSTAERSGADGAPVPLPRDASDEQADHIAERS